MTKKASAKTGGRKKGTPNKKTIDLISKLNDADFCPVERLVELIDREEEFRLELQRSNTSSKRKTEIKHLMMCTEAYANTLLKMFDYIYPKRKSVEVKQESSGKIEFVTQDEFNKAKE